jgi:hypothetical protein
MGLDAKTLGWSAVFAVGGLFVGQNVHIPFFCVLCEDGNPVGYHLTGLFKTDRTSSLNLTGCQTMNQPACTIFINIATGKKGDKPGPYATACPSTKNCFTLTGTNVSLSSEDSSTEIHKAELVNALGAVEIVLPTRPRNSH